MKIDRAAFFASVRASPFGGKLTQSQVDGMNALLDTWEGVEEYDDRRWLAYCLATTFYETGQAMQPVDEIGHGAGHDYGVPDPETGQAYYGRGYVQLTGRENYRFVDRELGLEGEESCEWHADHALDPHLAGIILFLGMNVGWFRAGHDLRLYFSATRDDPVNAREIVNGDKNVVPSWSGGVAVGQLIANYHRSFLAAVTKASPPEPSMTTVFVLIAETGELKFTDADGQPVKFVHLNQPPPPAVHVSVTATDDKGNPVSVILKTAAFVAGLAWGVSTFPGIAPAPVATAAVPSASSSFDWSASTFRFDYDSSGRLVRVPWYGGAEDGAKH